MGKEIEARIQWRQKYLYIQLKLRNGKTLNN